jgi:ATP-dependent DNA ligase
VTRDQTVARDWFDRFEGAGLDGQVAKPLDGPYVEDKRVQWKIKHRRTADCVVAGFRWHKDGNGIGSLLLGLYDDHGDLHHLGVAASFAAKRRAEFKDILLPLTEGALDGHPWREWADPGAHGEGSRMPGAPSRWNAQKDLSFTAVRLELVCEVEYVTVTSGRFRGVTTFVRWRPDREPSSCHEDQLVEPAPVALSTIFDVDLPR